MYGTCTPSGDSGAGSGGLDGASSWSISPDSASMHSYNYIHIHIYVDIIYICTCTPSGESGAGSGGLDGASNCSISPDSASMHSCPGRRKLVREAASSAETSSGWACSRNARSVQTRLARVGGSVSAASATWSAVEARSRERATCGLMGL